ncbi:MAG TPA: rod shape-determining protein MreC [Phycisphaerae bacterium]|nr:rod shape-determining protein MreC [Phycisphaerae bacterium]
MRTPSKPTIFMILMLLSGVSVFLPPDLFGPARVLTQLVAVPQWAAQRATQHVAEPIQALAAKPMAAEELVRLQRQDLALENENTVLRQQVYELQLTVQELTLLRRQSLQRDGIILPAPVVALDAAPGRDSMLLGKGKVQGAKREDWVASRLLVQVGQQDGVQGEEAVLARETLIGRIEETSPLTSRVVLLSDPYTNRAMKVRIMHFDHSSQRYLQVTSGGRIAEFVLRGAGAGRMVVPDIRKDFTDAGVVAVGDLVTSDPQDPRLPLGMVIGEITELRHNKDNPLLHDAMVQHRYDPKNLSQVYIVDLSRGSKASR